MSKNICIGILGGGQLAKMSLQAAARLGIDVAILEKEADSPAGRLTKHEFVGSVDAAKLLRRFADRCDVITLENEFVDHHRLKVLEQWGKKVFPSSETIAKIQDKLLQKEVLAIHGIPVPRFIDVTPELSFFDIAAVLGSPFVLKSRKMGYDGYGNALVKKPDDFHKAVKRLSQRHVNLLAESYVSFSAELAVMVVRTKKEIAVYPVVETIQKNHICHTVIAPARISKKLTQDAEEIAVECVKAINGYGLFGIEMFLDANNTIIVNEMAPRPHNSGHYTIEGCVTSQFENHVRAVLDLPLGSTAMIHDAAVMINVLGKPKPKKSSANLAIALKQPNIHFHQYGKSSSRIGRKMGHLTVVGDDVNKLLKEASELEKKIRL